MRRFLKCLLSFTCVLCLLLTAIPYFAVSASVQEADTEFVFSEYEFITTVRAMDDDELKDTSLTDSEIQMIRSNAIENKILERKQLSDSELAVKYGYTYDDIAILRSYNGERLENSAELAAITGTLTIARPTVLTATASRIGVQVVWTWDQCPFVNAEDVFAIYWDPTFGSQSGNMRINMTDSSHVVKYKHYTTSYNYNWDITQVSPNSAAKSNFGMQDKSGEAWAQQGTLRLYFDATAGSAALTSIDFIFAYGHTIISLSPSVSFPASGGISFGFATNEADRRSGYINVSSKSWYDN